MRSPKNIEPSTVVLTFDDGPNGTDSITLKLLEILQKHQVKAHFCLIGSNVKEHPDIVRKIYSDGHPIVCHGFDDRSILLKSNKTISDEMDLWHNEIKIALNTDSFTYRYFRPPYGMYRPGLRKILSEKNLKILPFSFYALDAQKGPKGKFEVLDETVKKIRKSNGGVIVLHDGRDSRAKMAREIAKDPSGSYNRAWIPEIVDSLITILSKENYHFTEL
ncbi:MAG: polysaccharide deacetylase family protein [Fibrobacter sp.]|nr:polysaccharide deacetylase family protein [Fibrobacter sp.]